MSVSIEKKSKEFEIIMDEIYYPKLHLKIDEIFSGNVHFLRNHNTNKHKAEVAKHP